MQRLYGMTTQTHPFHADRQIDQLVYELYDLIPQEIRIGETGIK